MAVLTFAALSARALPAKPVAAKPRVINETQALSFIDQHGGSWVNDHNCVSCHSAWSYGMGRIGTAGWQNSMVPKIESYSKMRLADWENIRPWYGSQGDAKGSEALGSEAILAASLLTEIDIARGQSASNATYQAVSRMLELQNSDGAISWLNFSLQPLESTTARIFGASLARIALSRSKLDAKYEFTSGATSLNLFLARAAKDQTVYLYYKAMIAWAAAESPGMLSRQDVSTLVQLLLAKQNADGGWSMNHLGNWKKTGNFKWSGDSSSDANATAPLLLALSRVDAAYAAGGEIPGLKNGILRARSWLVANQNANGSWSGVSLNIDDDENHGFMSDFATGLALRAMRQ
jgi:hypothetical protein